MNQDKFKNLIASIPTEWLQQEDVKDREGTDCHFGSKRSRRQFRTTNCPQGTSERESLMIKSSPFGCNLSDGFHGLYRCQSP